jgi:hypothetical protein
LGLNFNTDHLQQLGTIQGIKLMLSTTGFFPVPFVV